ncbi:hypothetical protein QAD02_014520, partial [Eretmocerus hayati]
MQGTNHSSHDNTPTPTPLSHLNSLMSSTNSHNFPKIKTEHNDLDILSNKSGLEALQAAMSGGSFNLPFPFSNPSAFLNPAVSQHSQLSSLQSHHQHHTTHQHQSQTGSNGTSAMPTSSASSHSSESSQGSGRNNGLELGPEARRDSQSSSQQQQNNSWSFEEQFKQVRQ